MFRWPTFKPHQLRNTERDDRCFHKGHWLLLHLTFLDCLFTVGFTRRLIYFPKYFPLCFLHYTHSALCKCGPCRSSANNSLASSQFQVISGSILRRLFLSNTSVWSTRLTLRFDIFYLLCLSWWKTFKFSNLVCFPTVTRLTSCPFACSIGHISCSFRYLH